MHSLLLRLVMPYSLCGGKSASEDNVIVYNVETTQATQFSKELSVNVKRGQRSRLEKGYYPGRAATGYLNYLVPESTGSSCGGF